MKMVITHAAEPGRAYEALVEVLAGTLDLCNPSVEQVLGATNPLERLLFCGIPEAALRERLARVL